MADEHNENPKKGFTVSELEGKAKKYSLEIALCVIFLLSAIFALLWGGAMMVWSILLTMILGIVSVLVPGSVHKITTSTLHFIFKEKVTTIIAGVVGLLLSIFLPPAIFGIVGLIAGKTFARDAEHHKKEF